MKRIYFFDEGNAEMKDLLGGKGANLAEMTRIGLPVPPGFTITTEVCREYYAAGGRLPDGLEDEIIEAMHKLEKLAGSKFGDPENPLLVSVRSGAPVSMPGMMDTILNLGLNDETVKGLAKLTNNERFAYDSYRRFIMMFSDVVRGVNRQLFEEALEEIKKKYGAKTDAEVPAEGMKELVERSKEIYKEQLGEEFPQDVWKQLMMAVDAVFRSWNNERAILYRKIHNIPDDMGTAVNVVKMVFGNMGDDSATGVAFTRNPSTGEKELYGEYLINAQGEDVVAGIRTPKPVKELKNDMPKVYDELVRVAEILEKHYRDMQDMEFTIEKGKLYMLQTRTGKRTAAAAVKIAVDMVKEGLITKEEAIMRVTPEQIETLLHKRIDPTAEKTLIAKGLPASPGAATGMVVFDSDEAVKLAEEGKKVILVRPETTPDDLHGMVASQGILTSRGGMTSHAAVVARGMGKPAVVGCEEISIDLEKEQFIAPNGKIFKKGDIITIDGSTGEVYEGEVPLIDPQMSGEFKELLEWADEIRVLGVYANADTPEDAAKAREFGAEGIGLARTEHMFLGPERVKIVQRMIMADTPEERREALKDLGKLQKSDFKGILEVMDGLPVTIRLLDPPLHEFLPAPEDLAEEIRKLEEEGAPAEIIEEKKKLYSKAVELAEHNPMMGFRGCRLGLIYPEIYEMQVEALIEAAAELKKEGKNPVVKIMHPLVGHVNEMKRLRELTDKVAFEVLDREKVDLKYKVGTMIEVPRAALTAYQIAEYAEFFSFGTNDLTQMTFGFSRDDAEGKFLAKYVEEGILPKNPFVVLDRDGVGRLIKIAVTEGRKTRADLDVGICGEHGGNPESIEFCHLVGLDYVSASPYRVPVARLAAAQAAIKYRDKKQ